LKRIPLLFSFFLPGDSHSFVFTARFQVEVTSVDVLELDQLFSPLQQRTYPGPFQFGDSINYISTATTDPPMIIGNVTRSIQLNIFATNALGQDIVNFYLIAFTNDCDAYPVLNQGDSAGWTQFVSGNVV
jgi:hypothetical protein